MKLIVNKKIIILFVSILFVSVFLKTAFAVWDGNPYDPGETLNPECLPSDPNCDILAPLTYLNIDDTVYGPSWDTDTTHAPSKNAVYDIINAQESVLTFGNGLTRTINAVANNLITGVVGGQTIIGGTAVGDGLTYKSTTGAGTTTGIAHQFVGGTDGGTVAMTILNDGNIGIGTITNPVTALNFPATSDITKGISFGNGDSKIYAVNDTGITFSTGATPSTVLLQGGVMRNGNGYMPGIRFSTTSSATVPTLTPRYGDADTGIGGPTGGDELSFIAGGVEGQRITEVAGNITHYFTGNVGIGTITPSGILSVTPTQYNTGTASQSLTTVTGVGTTFTSAMVGSQFVFADGTSAGTITAFDSATSLTVSTSQTVTSQAYNIAYTGLQVNSLGNVGIGTTTPTHTLQVVGEIKTNKLRIGDYPDFIDIGGSSSLYSSITGDNLFFQNGAGEINFQTTTAKDIGFKTNSLARMIITGTSGNVGIGTITPTANFQVAQGTAGVGTVSNSAGGTTVTGVGTQFTNTFKIGDTITINGETVAISAIASDTSMTTAAITGANSGIAYTLTGGTRFSVLGNGNVGIGTTSPGEKLSVYSTASAKTFSIDGTTNPAIVLKLSGVVKGYAPAIASSGGAFFTDASVGDFIFRSESNKVLLGVGSGYSSMAFITGGNVGIGVTSPTAVLHLKAGTTGVNTAPLKFTSGALNTTAEVGAIEFLDDAYYGTITTGAERKQFAFTSDITNSALLLDQTTPQTITGGIPIFGAGLDVGTTIAGANQNIYATLGADNFDNGTDFVVAGNWDIVAGTGWEATNDGGIQLNKNANWNPLTPAVFTGFTPVVGTTYLVTIIANEVSVSGFNFSLGGVFGNATWISTAGTYTAYIKASTTVGLTISPNPTTSRFKINSISIKALTDATGDAYAYGDIFLGGTIRNLNGQGGISIDPNGKARIPNIAGALTIETTLTTTGTTYFGTSGTLYLNPTISTLRLGNILMASGTTNLIYAGSSGGIYTYTYGGEYPLKWGTNEIERMRLIDGNLFIGTTDTDGTPAVGRLTVKGSTNDGSTNILVGRDSDEVNVFSVDTNGFITGAGLTSSLLIGGSAIDSKITYKSTTGAGTVTDIAHQFVGGTDGGTTAMTILNNGNVGIGTTGLALSPTSKINIEDSSTTPMGLSIYNTSTGSAATAQVSLRSANATLVLSASNYYATGTVQALTGEKLALGANYGVGMTFDTSNNIGIGTTTPTANFQVAQGTAGVGTVSNSAGGTTVTGVGTQFLNTFKVGDTITINGETVAISAIASDTSMTTAAITGANSGVAYTLTGGTRFSVLGNGNVGIGTTVPKAKLQVGTTPTDTGSFIVTGPAFFKSLTANNNAGDTPAPMEPVLILGRDGVSGYSYANYAQFNIGRYVDSGASAKTQFDIRLMDGLEANGTAIMSLQSGGNVGIGTTGPSYKLHVSDTTTAGIVGAFTNSDGTCTLDPGDVGGWSCPSDISLKKDITNIDSGLAQINQLRPVNFRWLSEDETTMFSMGLIAQEVQPIFPKLVTTQLNGTLSLNYSGFTPVIIEAIQDIDLKLEDLTNIEVGLVDDSGNETFVGRFFSRIKFWLGDVANGIENIYVKVVHSNKSSTKELCIVDDIGAETCITKTQLDNLLLNANVNAVGSSTPSPVVEETVVEETVAEEPVAEEPVVESVVEESQPEADPSPSSGVEPLAEVVETSPEPIAAPVLE